MRLLLDTHCFLWLQTHPERFSEGLLALLASDENELLLSSASAWEIAIRYGLGKLSLPLPPSRYVPTRMASSGVEPLAIEIAHGARVAELPPHHRDPFDRLLVAQAQLEKLTLVTADDQIEAYDVELMRV
ncbi:MAG: type II toxin-antitoxin system VapC family toxin [Myxococcota bacterium]